MALKYQFNKMPMQSFNKQLKVRRAALPTLKSKEAFLRVTIKKQKEELQKAVENYQTRMNEMQSFIRLWAEFPENIFYLKDVVMSVKKIAGIKAPNLEKINYEIAEYSNFNNPVWLQSGINILKEITILLTEIEITKKRITILEYARKKTTQKVNLYEKVQIPQYAEAILKIKRYLEDVDNLDKAAQKITKQKQQAEGGTK
ncbi:MAG TPA: V-type ATP synthase subunit D [Spirochaetota bacterium]|nr:V-type ATP synthase subunit D [Spirochaetota bacterium]